MSIFINGFFCGVVVTVTWVVYIDYAKFRARQKDNAAFNKMIVGILTQKQDNNKPADILHIVKNDGDKQP